MKTLKNKKIVIITGLPFRKQGNQSLLRFVNMFLDRKIKVTMFSAGFDPNGENVLSNSLFSVKRIKSLEIALTIFLNQRFFKEKILDEHKKNIFQEIKSETVLPPYGEYNLFTLLGKWSKWFLVILDNILLFLSLNIRFSDIIKKADIIIGYEDNFTLCAKWISSVWRKKYINKFQGTILRATNRNKSLAIRYFPHNYFSLNKSDLCLMVNDGTDGDYYAKEIGCKEIFFEPHGVLRYEHKGDEFETLKKLKKTGKFILFNNASGSTWKRPDRSIRALLKIRKDILKDILLITTYYGPNRAELIEYTKASGLDRNVLFVERLDNIQCNYILQNSDVVIMTNDISNLGNPVLEAIFYKIPIISINDGSLDGFVTDKKDSLLVDLDVEFDENVANAIEKLYKDREYYQNLKRNMNKNNQVKELSVQQAREFNHIQNLFV